MEKNSISSALSDYLEAIYVLSLKFPAVRITDVAKKLGISKPSANRAVKSLKQEGYVLHEPYGDIILTQKGNDFGKAAYAKRITVKKFLTDVLGIDEEEANREACMIVHTMSEETLERLEKYMNEQERIIFSAV